MVSQSFAKPQQAVPVRGPRARSTELEAAPDADTPRPVGVGLLLCMLERGGEGPGKALIDLAARLQVGGQYSLGSLITLCRMSAFTHRRVLPTCDNSTTRLPANDTPPGPYPNPQSHGDGASPDTLLMREACYRRGRALAKSQRTEPCGAGLSTLADRSLPAHDVLADLPSRTSPPSRAGPSARASPTSRRSFRFPAGTARRSPRSCATGCLCSRRRAAPATSSCRCCRCGLAGGEVSTSDGWDAPVARATT